MLADEDPVYFDAIVKHLKAKAKALSDPDDEGDIDWDETYGGE